MTPVTLGETDDAHERVPNPAREILVAASDVVGCLWTDSYAALCANGLARDMRIAQDRHIPIVVIRLPNSPPIPDGLFPPNTRVTEVSDEPAQAALVIKRLHDGGLESFPLLKVTP